MFGDTTKPNVELYIDASNEGLAVLDPAANEFIQIKFDEEEQKMIAQVPSIDSGFSINVREHLCIALALWSWGAKWYHQSSGQLVHVKCWSDNTSAVMWCNRLHSKNLLSQEINRSIGLAEAYYNLRVSADHIPGSSNWMADAASRAWTEPNLQRWANFSSSWIQTRVPSKCRKIYTNFSSHFKPDHWPRLQRQNIAVLGSGGVNGASGCNSQSGYQKTHADIPISSHYLLHYGWDPSSSGNSAGTVLSKISHISWHHRRTLGYSVCLLPGHQLAITGMRRSNCINNTKSPVTTDILKHMHEELDFTAAQHRVICGASVLGFFFLLRRSEYLALGSKVHNYAICRSDIKFVGADEKAATSLRNVCAVVVNFRGSKSDQFGVGATRRLERSGSSWCCPLAAWYLVQHHKSLGASEDTLLCKIDSTNNLQVHHVVLAIKKAAKAAGQAPEHYGSHSLRSGGATALFNAGFDSLAVKLFGRWKSDAMERYTRIGERLMSTMAREMLAKPAIEPARGISKPHPGIGGASMHTSH